MGQIHCGTWSESNGAVKLYRALKRAGAAGLTTAEIDAAIGTINAHCYASMLRKLLRDRDMPETVVCKYSHLSEAGRKVYRYRLVQPAKVTPPPPAAVQIGAMVEDERVFPWA